MIECQRLHTVTCIRRQYLGSAVSPGSWTLSAIQTCLPSPDHLPTVCTRKQYKQARSGGARTHREPQCANGSQDVPVTGTAAPGILIAIPRGASGQSASRLRPGYSPVTFIQDLRDLARHKAGPLGPWGCGRRSLSGAAELHTRRQRRCSALRPARCLPMGTVRAPGPAASGAGPRKPVGNRAPIGASDNRSASVQPIRGGGHGSGAFGVGLECDNRRTPGT